MLPRTMIAPWIASTLLGISYLGTGAARADAETNRLTRAFSPGHTTYYVNATSGHDSNTGTSSHAAWMSLTRVNQTQFAPGDTIRFAGGQRFTGTLHFTAGEHGVKGHPIVVTSFGKGRATIEGGSGDGCLLEGCAFVTLRDLTLTGCGRKNGSDGAGVRLVRTSHVEIVGLEASGFRVAGIATSGDEKTRITQAFVHDNGAAGIDVNGGYGNVPRVKDIYIGHCVADNNPGDPKNLTNHSGNGIVVGGLDSGMIEYCEASNNGWDMPHKGNGPVGIWGWECDRLTIQHCIAHDNHTTSADGDGFDFDGGVTHSILQYNLSYNNDGCGYLLCQYPGASLWKNNTVRFNISVNDGAKNFQSGIGLWIGGPNFSDAKIYNNTIVNLWHAVNTYGDVPDFVYRNNLFVAGGDLLVGPYTHSRFEQNLYWCTGKGDVYHDEKTHYATLGVWADATGQETIGGKLVGRYADPRLVLPASGDSLPTDPQQLEMLPFYRLLPDSPALGAGAPIPDNGGRDLFGDRLAAGQPLSQGAHSPQR